MVRSGLLMSHLMMGFMCALVCAAEPSWAAVRSMDIIAKAGDPVPGAPTETIATIEGIAVNGLGQIGFAGQSTGSTTQVYVSILGGTTFTFLGSSDPDIVGATMSSGLGIGDGPGEFAINVDLVSPGLDGLYTDDGVVINELDNAPGYSSYDIGSIGRVTMLPDGAAYAIASLESSGSFVGRALYRFSPDGSTADLIVGTDSVLVGVGPGGGDYEVGNSISFSYDVSSNGQNVIGLVREGISANTESIYLNINGVVSLPFREGGQGLIGDGRVIESFDGYAIDNAGNYAFIGNVTGSGNNDELLVYNGTVLYKEGDVIDGVALGSVGLGAYLNNSDQLLFSWNSAAGEHAFLADVADPGAAQLIASIGDLLDVDGDGVGDFELTDIQNSYIIGDYNAFTDDGVPYLYVKVMPVGGGDAVDAVIRPAASTPLAGDYNGDGVVDPSDYAFWSNQYAAVLGGGIGDPAADGNGDGVIDPSDYAFWSNEYAAVLAGGSVVPEPTTLALLAAGGWGLIVRRKLRLA